MTKFSIEALKPGYKVYFPSSSTNYVYIQPTANAWWSDPSRVHQFLAVIGIDGTILQACIHIGITLKQYKYFQSLHPEFRELRNAYSLITTMKARQTIARNLNNGKVAMWLLERKHPEEFSLPAIRKNRGLREWEQRRKVGPALTPEQADKIARLANGTFGRNNN